SNRKIVKMLK
ncbi:oligoendopeptidase, PepF/M3 family domain protein, partial [Vibrio parahaemolyticus V-223/04]